MIHQSGATRELSAVSRSGICASGMYIIGIGIAIGAAIVRVAHDADNLTGAFSKGWSGAGSDLDAILQRIAFGPILAGHGLVDDDDAGCSGIILFSETAATQQRNFECTEVSPGNGIKACVAGER